MKENVLNNNSMVAKLSFCNVSLLFTGDIEEKAEKKLLQDIQANPKQLNATILKVAHHGSKTSSTQEILNQIKPKIALIGVGKNNKFGHPNNEVLQRLNAMRMQNLPHRPNGRNSNYSQSQRGNKCEEID